MQNYEIRVTGERNMQVVKSEVMKRSIPGFACREISKKGVLHAHYLVFTDEKYMRQMKQAFRAQGLSGNEHYKTSHVRDFERYANYICKEYTPETLEYSYGVEYTHEWFQARRDTMDASFDPKKAGGKKRPRAEAMLEEICDGLDSSSDIRLIAYRVLEYCRNHFDDTKFWTRERKNAVLKNVELQLKGSNVDYIESEIDKIIY